MTEVILHITAGKGPQECRWVVAQMTRAFAREARDTGLASEVLDGAEGLPASVLLRIAGEGAAAFAALRRFRNTYPPMQPRSSSDAATWPGSVTAEDGPAATIAFISASESSLS